jgi:hypothetical protein
MFYVTNELAGTITFAGVEWNVTFDGRRNGRFHAEAPGRSGDWTCFSDSYERLLDEIEDTTERCLEYELGIERFEHLCSEALRLPIADRRTLGMRLLAASNDPMEVLWGALSERTTPVTKPADPSTVPMPVEELTKQAVVLSEFETRTLASVLVSSFPESFTVWALLEALSPVIEEHQRAHRRDRAFE